MEMILRRRGGCEGAYQVGVSCRQTYGVRRRTLSDVEYVASGGESLIWIGAGHSFEELLDMIQLLLLRSITEV